MIRARLLILFARFKDVYELRPLGYSRISRPSVRTDLPDWGRIILYYPEAEAGLFIFYSWLPPTLRDGFRSIWSIFLSKTRF